MVGSPELHLQPAGGILWRRRGQGVRASGAPAAWGAKVSRRLRPDAMSHSGRPNNALKLTKRGSLLVGALRAPSSLNRASQLSAVLSRRHEDSDDIGLA